MKVMRRKSVIHSSWCKERAFVLLVVLGLLFNLVVLLTTSNEFLNVFVNDYSLHNLHLQS